MSSDGVPAAIPAESSEALLAFADALLARGPRDAAQGGGDLGQFVTFFLCDHEIALPILQCREILRVPPITRVPEAPKHVRGVINLRGRIVPAIDARSCLGFETSPLTARSRLLVVEVESRHLALVVDRISRIVKLSSAEMRPPPESSAVPSSIGIVPLDGNMLFITDVARILYGGSVSPWSSAKDESP